MFDEYKICPYTGLRSFTEEESIYFKGRDQHIQIATKLLEQNKFLMLTGASGDGKSSLVYAGVIPNAKAGFLKSHYSHWEIADFRPQKSPFKNFAATVARALRIDHIEAVEAELGHGFSALIDLYKNSELYQETKAKTDYQKTDLQKGANLIILADQFEEFFTYPSNYTQGVPSQDATLVVNLLLETARIALEDNLPIYVVCTMRSDFIGQCAAFRGLPEGIGFSQFFVPRLNRKQIHEVIEEPSVLSGNKITKRLTERLIHDLTEGVDQLPILQHALNQIWKAADDGKEEMDLIHYAMVGGMKESELPDDQVLKFFTWFNELPDKIRECYDEPSLQNVINTHANKIFVTAADYFYEHSDDVISDANAQLVIQGTFKCLTKIDQSRAVRHQMTIQEITGILNQPHLDERVVGIVLNIFREPGNTFIKPFITESDETLELRPDSVLDITHESLIRNWQKLNKWAYQEFENLNIFLDLKQQLNRWVQNQQNKGFLLPIGPLTYFENWYKKLNPNKYWINRYQEQNHDATSNLQEAEVTLNHAQRFLKKSVRKHLITHTFMRYGARRIAAVLAILLLLSVSSFYYYDSVTKQNEYVLKSILSKGRQLTADPKVNMTIKATNLILQEQIEPGTISAVMLDLSLVDQTELAVGISSDALFNSHGKDFGFTINNLRLADSLMDQFSMKGLAPLEKQKIMDIRNKLIHALAYSNHFNAKDDLGLILLKHAEVAGNTVLEILSNPGQFDWDASILNTSLETALNFGGWNQDQIQELISIFSPFENNERNLDLERLYQFDKRLDVGQSDSYFLFNGRYQELAYLYAATGNLEKAIMCVDTLVKYHDHYNHNSESVFNIGAYFIIWDHSQHIEPFMKACAVSLNQDYLRLFHRFSDHVGKPGRYTQSLFDANAVFSGIFHNPNYEYFSLEHTNTLFSIYQQVLESEVDNPDERYFSLALLYKTWGLVHAIHRIDDDQDPQVKAKPYFIQSLAYYRQVNTNYLKEIIDIPILASGSGFPAPRKVVYIYPDHLPVEIPYELRTRWMFSESSAFLDFLTNNQLFRELYKNAEDFDLLINWEIYYLVMSEYNFFGWNRPVDISSFLKLDQQISEHPLSQQIDRNLLSLIIAKKLYVVGDSVQAQLHEQNFDPAAISKILNIQRDLGLTQQIVLNHIMDLFVAQVFQANIPKAVRLITEIKNPVNRAIYYAMAAAKLYQVGKTGLGNIMMDSALKEDNRKEVMSQSNQLQIAVGPLSDTQSIIAYALASQLGQDNELEILKRIRNYPIFAKTRAHQFIGSAYSRQTALYQSHKNIPPYLSKNNQLFTDNVILHSWIDQNSFSQGLKLYFNLKFSITPNTIFFNNNNI